MKRPIAALLLMFLLVPAQGSCASLYEVYSRKAEAKVYVAVPTDKTGKDKVLVDDLKKKIEEALKARKSVRFAVVAGKDDAELTVETETVEFFWTDHDPIDMIVGVGATAMDAATVQDYVRVTAWMTVTDQKSGKQLWREKLMATVTKSGMPEKDAAVLVNDDLAKNFVIQAFGKKKARGR